MVLKIDYLCVLMELSCQKASTLNYILITLCAATFKLISSGMFVLIGL